MITKAEVRAVALAALGPGTGDLVWDVGCGSGVGRDRVRPPRRRGRSRIDDDPDAIALDDRATPPPTTCRSAPSPAPRPEALAGPARPGRDVRRRRRSRARRDPRPRRPDHPPRGRRDRSRSIDRIAPTMERLAAHGLDVTATTLQANRLKPLAGGHRLAAENPVTVIVGRRA